MTLAAEDPADRLAGVLATRPEVKLIDFTGGNAFGDWLEEHARQATVFTEKAGVNTVVIDSTERLRARCARTSRSRSRSTPARCAPRRRTSTCRPTGSTTDDGVKSPAEVGAGIGAALDRLLGDDARAVELLGGVVNAGVLERLEAVGSRGDVLVASRTVTHPAYADATVRTPTLVGADGRRRLPTSTSRSASARSPT